MAEERLWAMEETVLVDAEQEEEQVEVRLWSCRALSLMCCRKRLRSSSGVWPCWARTMQVGRWRFSM